MTVAGWKWLVVCLSFSFLLFAGAPEFEPRSTNNNDQRLTLKAFVDDCAALGDEAGVEDFVVSVFVLEVLRFGVPEVLDEIVEVGGQHECGVCSDSSLRDSRGR